MSYAVKAVFIIIGTISILLGILGIIVPLLPTTPFLLLGAACYVRGSEKLYLLLIKNKWLGGYIEDFRVRKGISQKNKILSLSVLWVSVGSSLFFVITSGVAAVFLVIIAAAVSAYLLSFKTL
ncbi:DUF454 family protein [Mesobacillus harenae]|uniref:DUF454 family protein n=1 Tax=Mesobacillus harenae TaxID=2213203 RepID=UPI0015806F23